MMRNSCELSDDATRHEHHSATLNEIQRATSKVGEGRCRWCLWWAILAACDRREAFGVARSIIWSIGRRLGKRWRRGQF